MMNSYPSEINLKEKVVKYLEEIKKKEHLNAFIELNNNIIKDVEILEKKDKKRKLYGLVLAIKSNINVKGLRATCASKTLENYVSTYDATVVKRLKNEDALIIGMTNMDEFACGSSGETSYFGPTLNPRNEEIIPGGSSSGSAAAVAANLCDASLGTDTGGSIRNPCSHCGVYGLKPTYGLVSRHGLIDLAMSFDTIGPIARDVETLAKILEVIAGYDEKDSTTYPIRKYDFTSKLKRDVTGYKIALVKQLQEITDKKILNIIEKVIEFLHDKGCRIYEISIPNIEKGLPTYYLINFVEFFSATRKYDGRRYGYRIEEVCGEEVLRRILIGRYISQKEYVGKYYRKALQFRNLIRKSVLKALKDIDVIISAVTPKLPHKLGEKIPPLEMYKYDLLTVIANLAGIPAGVAPVGKVDRIPVGVQIMAKSLEEQKILNLMYCLEEINPFK